MVENDELEVSVLTLDFLSDDMTNQVPANTEDEEGIELEFFDLGINSIIQEAD